MSYIGSDGHEHEPIMIHRALLGSLERFLGCLIEHYGGAFPIWLAPIQIKVLKHGKAMGAIIGGNLTLILESIGTPYEIQTRNKILFIEEISEHTNTILDGIKELKNKGKLDGIKGVIFGRMTDCFKDEDEFIKCMNKIFAGTKYPILHNFPSGHTEDIAHSHLTLPLGVPVFMDTKELFVEIMESTVN